MYLPTKPLKKSWFHVCTDIFSMYNFNPFHLTQQKNLCIYVTPCKSVTLVNQCGTVLNKPEKEFNSLFNCYMGTQFLM